MRKQKRVGGWGASGIFGRAIGLAFSLALFLAGSVSAQTPCSPGSVESMPGRWIKDADALADATQGGFASSKVPLLLKKMDRYYALVSALYPDLKGMRAKWKKRISGDLHFSNGPKPHNLDFFFHKYLCEGGTLVDSSVWERSSIFIFVNSLEQFVKSTGELRNGKLTTYQGKVIYRMSHRLGKHGGYDYFEPPHGDGFGGWGLQHFRTVLITYPGKLPFRYLTRRDMIDFLRAQLDEEQPRETDRLKLIYPVRPKEVQEAEKTTQVEKLKKEYANSPRRVQRYLEDYRTDEQKLEEAAAKLKADFDKRRFVLDKIEKKYTGRLDEIGTVWESDLHYGALDDDWDFMEDKGKDDHLCNSNGICWHGSARVVMNEDYFDKKLAPDVPQLFTVCFAWTTLSHTPFFVKMKDDWLNNFKFDELAGMLGK
jgi:hypothetical protein